MLTKITDQFIDSRSFVRKSADDDATYDSQGNYNSAISGNKKFLSNVEIDGTLTVNGDTNWNFTSTGAISSSSSGSFNQIRVTNTGWFDHIRFSISSGVVLPSSVLWFNSGSSTSNLDLGTLSNKADITSGTVESGKFKYLLITGNPDLTEVSFMGYSGLGVIDVQEITSKAGCSYSDGRFRSSGIHISSSGNVQCVLDSHNDTGITNKGFMFSIAKYAKLLSETNNPGLDGCCNPNFTEIFRVDSLGNVTITGGAYIMSGLHLSGDLTMTGDIEDVRNLNVTGTLTATNLTLPSDIVVDTLKANVWLSGLMITGGNMIIRGDLTGQNLYAEQYITGHDITGYDGKFGHDFLVWGELSGANITGDLIRPHHFSGNLVSGNSGFFNNLWAKSGQFSEKLTVGGVDVLTSVEGTNNFTIRPEDQLLWAADVRTETDGWAFKGAGWTNYLTGNATDGTRRNNWAFIDWTSITATNSYLTTGHCAPGCGSGDTYLNFSPSTTGLFLLDFSAFLTGSRFRWRWGVTAPPDGGVVNDGFNVTRYILQVRPSGEDYQSAKETGQKENWIIASGQRRDAGMVTVDNSSYWQSPISIKAPVYITGASTITIGFSDWSPGSYQYLGWESPYIYNPLLTITQLTKTNLFAVDGIIKSIGTGT